MFESDSETLPRTWRLVFNAPIQVGPLRAFLPRTLLASFGSDERFVIRAIVRHGIGSRDRIVLVTMWSNDKVERALEYVRELAEAVSAHMELIEFGSVYSFSDILEKCIAKLTELVKSSDRVIVLLSDGARALVLALYSAILMLSPSAKKRITVEVDVEDTSTSMVIPQELLMILDIPELGAKRRLLKTIARWSDSTIIELSKKVGKDESTVRRQLQCLIEMGLASVGKTAKGKGYTYCESRCTYSRRALGRQKRARIKEKDYGMFIVVV